MAARHSRIRRLPAQVRGCRRLPGVHPSSTPARTCALARRNRGLRARLHPKFAAALGTPHASKPASHMLPIACPVRRHAPQPRAGLYLLQNRKEMTRSTVAESIPLSHQHVSTPPTQRTPYDGSDHACRQCVAKPPGQIGRFRSYVTVANFNLKKTVLAPALRWSRRPPQAPPEAITAAAGAARRGFETPSQSRQAHPTVALRAAGRA